MPMVSVVHGVVAEDQVEGLRAAYDAMRSAGTPPAITLLQDAGARPGVTIYEVVAGTP